MQPLTTTRLHIFETAKEECRLLTTQSCFSRISPERFAEHTLQTYWHYFKF